MRGYRRAALTLHGLLPADREWMMAQLPESQREQLGSHLAELVHLGIPADRALLDDAVRLARSAQPLSDAPLDTRLRYASCDQILQVLVTEPDQLIALVLKIEPWPWRDELLERLGVERRGRVARLLRQLELKSGLGEALLSGLARRLERLPAPKAALVQPLRGMQRPDHLSRVRNSFRSMLKSWLL